MSRLSRQARRSTTCQRPGRSKEWRFALSGSEGAIMRKATFVSLLFRILTLCVIETPAHAQDEPGNAAPQTVPASSQASAGLLPVPDYSADFWARRALSGDWSGARTDLANKGIQL